MKYKILNLLSDIFFGNNQSVYQKTTSIYILNAIFLFSSVLYSAFNINIASGLMIILSLIIVTIKFSSLSFLIWQAIRFDNNFRSQF